MSWDQFTAWLWQYQEEEDAFPWLSLATHAFAMAEQIHRSGRPPKTAGRPKAPTLDSARQGILSAEGLPERFEALLRVLLAFEAELGDPAHRKFLPPVFELDSSSGLTGQVHLGWRSDGDWRRLRLHRREGVGPGPTSYALRAEDQLESLWMAWEQGSPLGYRPLRARGLHSRRVVTDLRLSALRVALCPLIGSPGPRFTIEGTTFEACPEHAPCTRETLTAVADAAARQGVSILVLPELHVRPEEAAHALGPEGPLLLLAGSFHVRDESGLRNRAPILVDGGYRLWEHDKRGYFRLTRDQVRRAGPVFEPAESVSEEVSEGIVGGDTLTVLDTALGRLAVVICADVLDPDAYSRAVEDARPDFLFILSLSAETEPFERRADDLSRLGISTFYVNAPPAGTSKALLGFCCLSLLGSARSPPTRLRWTEGKIEAWNRSEKWAAPLGGVAWLDPLLGLVIDLGSMVSDEKLTDETMD